MFRTSLSLRKGLALVQIPIQPELNGHLCCLSTDLRRSISTKKIIQTYSRPSCFVSQHVLRNTGFGVDRSQRSMRSACARGIIFSFLLLYFLSPTFFILWLFYPEILCQNIFLQIFYLRNLLLDFFSPKFLLVRKICTTNFLFKNLWISKYSSLNFMKSFYLGIFFLSFLSLSIFSKSFCLELCHSCLFHWSWEQDGMIWDDSGNSEIMRI